MAASRIAGRFLALVLCLAGTSCSGCWKKAAPAAQSTPAQPSAAASSAFRPAALDPNAPVISATLGGGDASPTYAGWPLIVVARLAGPDAGQPPTSLVIEGPGGDWPAALGLDVTDKNGRKVDWPFHLATTSTGTLALDGQTIGQAGWWLSPDETTHLAAGDYQLVVGLDTHTSTQGWKGAVASEALPIHLRSVPATMTDAQESARGLRLADWHMLQGDDAAASGDVDALLAHRPNDTAALSLKGDLLMAAGKPADALEAYDRAVELVVGSQPKGAEPPMILLSKRRAALKAADRGR